MTKLKCKKCGDIIVSKSVHDFRTCKCGACYIDGGFDYTRIGFKSMDEIEIIEEEN